MDQYALLKIRRAKKLNGNKIPFGPSKEEGIIVAD